MKKIRKPIYPLEFVRYYELITYKIKLNSVQNLLPKLGVMLRVKGGK